MMEVKEIDTEHFSTESNQSKIRQGFAQYCKETSLHGWHYVQSERNVLMKVMWFLLILLHYVIATVFIWKNFQEYSNGSTLATVQSATASLDEITFPSLYVCNLNQFTRSFLANIRDNQLFFFRIFAQVGIGLLLGFLYQGIGNDSSRVEDNIAMLFFCILFSLFTAMMPTIMTYPSEMKTFKREYLNNWYSIGTYVISKD